MTVIRFGGECLVGGFFDQRVWVQIGGVERKEMRKKVWDGVMIYK